MGSVNDIVMFSNFTLCIPQRQSRKPTSRRMLDRKSSPNDEPPEVWQHSRLACRGRRPRRPHLCIFSTPLGGGEAVGEGADFDIRGGCAPRNQAASRVSQPALRVGRILTQKRRFQDSAQFPLPQRLSDQTAQHVLVLTEKTGLFWGVLAAKSMFREIKMTLCFGVFAVF